MAKLDTLAVLAQTVNKNKVKNIQVIRNNPNSMSKMDVFYRALAEGKYESEEEAAEDLYSAGPDHGAYRKLKERVEERLVNTLFFIDLNQPNFTEYQRAYYSCYKAATATKILLGKHARSPAIKLAEKTLKYAMKFELTDIILLLAKVLRLHYGTIVGNKKKFEHYNKIVLQYTSLFNAELLAEEYYTQVVVNFVSSTATKPEVINLSKEFSAELKTLTSKAKSYRFNLLYFSLNAIRFELANNYSNTIEVCKEALVFFEQKKHLATNNAKFNFLLKILSAQIYLKQFDELESSIDQCISLVPAGSVNWYMVYDWFMIYLFHSRQFDRAASVYKDVEKDSKFKSQYKRISENWIIHEAFLQYFKLINKIKSEDQNVKQKFRISKFLNEVPTFSKDKRGTNITIIILQILFLLQQKKYGVIINRMESLRTYSYRYLRQDNTFRSNCFIKMLLCLPASSFHKKAVLRKADKYWKKLQSVPLEKANQSSDLEIVPYEMLWEFVLEGLDEKWH